MPTIRAATDGDAEAIARIYNHYVANTVVTFEERPVSIDETARRIAEVVSEPLPWLVGEEQGTVAGYAYAAKWKSRSAYRFSVESTIYLDPAFAGRRIGTALYEALLARLRTAPVHAVLAGIALPNDASVALHERLGFQKVAHLKELGFKFDRWVDVGYWQIVLSGSAVQA